MQTLSDWRIVIANRIDKQTVRHIHRRTGDHEELKSIKASYFCQLMPIQRNFVLFQPYSSDQGKNGDRCGAIAPDESTMNGSLTQLYAKQTEKN